MKNVTGQTLEGEVFIECADEDPFRFQDDVVVELIRYRPAIRDGSQFSAASTAYDAIYFIQVQVCTASAAMSREARSQHIQYSCKLFGIEALVVRRELKSLPRASGEPLRCVNILPSEVYVEQEITAAVDKVFERLRPVLELEDE